MSDRQINDSEHKLVEAIDDVEKQLRTLLSDIRRNKHTISANDYEMIELDAERLRWIDFAEMTTLTGIMQMRKAVYLI